MTTPDEVDFEHELARLLADRLRAGPGKPTVAEGYYGRECAKAVLTSSWLAGVVAQAKADAWDEGNRHEAEYLDTWGQFDPNPTNPYREPTP